MPLPFGEPLIPANKVVPITARACTELYGNGDCIITHVSPLFVERYIPPFDPSANNVESIAASETRYSDRSSPLSIWVQEAPESVDRYSPEPFVPANKDVPFAIRL